MIRMTAVLLSVALVAEASIAVESENYAKDIRVEEWQSVTNPPPETAKYRDASLPIEERIDDLLRWMTPYEKVKAIHACGWMSSGGIKRIGLAEFRTIDGGSGPRARNRAGITYLPCGIAWAAAWDPDLAEEVGRVSGEETRAVYPGWEGGSARMLLGDGRLHDSYAGFSPLRSRHA